ncbi:MAG: glucose-6-phosphate dehydrogenase [Spirochaetaceae bacterium]|nr:glucose-6-phosphate dehydrogenase [Spirochaetaceae bacterium]
MNSESGCIPEKLSSVFIIFGATGDLTRRKLMSALYNLVSDDLLPKNFVIIAIGRQDKTTDQYREEVLAAIIKYSRNKVDPKIWQKLSSMIIYHKFDFKDLDEYVVLKSFIRKVEKDNCTEGNRVFYLAVAPLYFETIVEGIQKGKLNEDCSGFCRCVIEKPFGKNLETATKLNESILKVFSEKNIYRIDHYLGKDMIQNIMVLRFCNSVFESIWDNKHIDNIQISLTEELGIGSRANYYEQSGAMRDMFQNHIMQIMSLVAMEPPVNLNMDSIRNEKQKVLESIEEISDEFLKKNVIFGQYGEGIIHGEKVSAYRDEENVNHVSETETFVALKMHINNFRWAGVPFYIRTGKRLGTTSGEIIVQFKDLPNTLYYKENRVKQPNLLILHIQPNVGVFFQFNTKDFTTHNDIVPAKMDTSSFIPDQGNTPEAYERLIHDILRGDASLFSRWDEVESAWAIADRIIKYREQMKIDLPNYKAGSMGPQRAFDLIEKDGRNWITV